MDAPTDIVYDLPDDEHNNKYVDEDSKLMEPEKKKREVPPEGFEVTKLAEPVSTFDKEQEKEAQRKKEEERRKNEVIDDDEPDYIKADEYEGQRKHCWIFINKGGRQIEESFFIEPSTGRRYNISDSPYYTVEAIFNHKNYWINMDCTRPIAEVSFDFENDNTGEWEFVMINNDDKRGEDDEEGADEDEDEDDGEGGANDEEVLDMPPPWSPKLYVKKDKFSQLCPKGKKTVFYKKCKVEFFAECKEVDGLIRRITIFEDYKKLITKEVRSFFRNRRDKLILRRRFPFEFKTIEHYESSEK